ncbi:MAG: transcription termination/antitermination factor NusG [Verrucomicrobiales bacterium]|nr:transcription termination/antitermination factor NusG [Verrucomicrobiales bacterium]
MASVPPPQDQWYVVQVLSGQEMKVKENIKRRIDAEEMADLVFGVLVPTERVSEVKGGRKMETNRKFFPGYVIVNMHLLDEKNRLVDRTWYFIRETPGVINFAGAKDHPVPMPRHEVESMLAQIKEREDSVKPAIQFEPGDAVTVSDGPFEGQAGVVAEINEDKGELMVSVNIFGRETLVPLEYWQVERG